LMVSCAEAPNPRANTAANSTFFLLQN